jgi:hypothetical protein
MLKKVAFVLALTLLVSVALALESGPSNTVGFVKVTCPASLKTPFGLPFTFWDVVSGVPQYGVPSGKPSDVIGAQLTGGTLLTGDQCIQQGGAGWLAYRAAAGGWIGTLEDNSGLMPGWAYWIWNKHTGSQNMVLAGQVDTSTFSRVIPASVKTALSFRDARIRPMGQLNLITSGFTGGTLLTSDQVIEQGGAGRLAYYTTSWQGTLTQVEPAIAYWIWNKHANQWTYNYGPGAVSRPPNRPGENPDRTNVIRPSTPSSNSDAR